MDTSVVTVLLAIAAVIVLIILTILAISFVFVRERGIRWRKQTRPESSETPSQPQPKSAGETAAQQVQPEVGEHVKETLPEIQPTATEEIQAIQLEEPQPAATQRDLVAASEEDQPTLLEAIERSEGYLPAPAQEAPPAVCQETHEAPPGETQLIATEQRKTRPAPSQRGGRPRGSNEPPQEEITGRTKSPQLKPEIICWNRGRWWIAAIEVPEDLTEGANIEVLQAGCPLERDDTRDNCWRLNSISDEVLVRVRWNDADGDKEIKVTASKASCLLFKLTGHQQDEGRCVKSASSGLYLVMAPNEWERDERLSGTPPVTPEDTSLPGYRAHFFVLEKKGGKIAFRTPEDEQPFVIATAAPRFELVGNQLSDASEKVGPLFGQAPPLICDGQTWQDVGTVVIGQEGSGRGRWRTAFSPRPEQTEQELPLGVAARKGGWYFLRFYDTQDDLIESLDFRFLSALKEIRIDQPPLLPSVGRHQLVRVELLHEPGCIIQPDNESTGVQIERGDEKTVLTIPPDPTCDETNWFVGSDNGPRVAVTILVERVWWAVADERIEPSAWQDRVVTLQHDDFKATSKKALWLRLPKRRWIDEVRVGFEQPKARPYPIKATKKVVCVPIRDFCDTPETRKIGMSPLKLWFRHGRTLYTASPCHLIVKIRCGRCNFTAPKEEDVLHHIESSHIGELFRPLTYQDQEMRAHDPSFPVKIYKCWYCDFYVESDDYRNPTSAINEHIERECPRAPRGMGPVPKRFRVISDFDEIRENVIRGPQRIHKCTLCGFDLHEATNKEMMQHLISTHQTQLCVLC